MRENLVGSLAKSKAGHDKEEIFVIMKEEAEYVYLVDGKNRTINHSKKKNRKHIQPIFWKSDLSQKIENHKVMDEDIKRAIKRYNSQRILEVQECQKLT